MIFKLVFTATILPVILCNQILFEDEKTGSFFPFIQNETTITIPKNISEIRGTTEYEKLVDNIISTGILKLTLAIDRAIASIPNNNKGYDNIVYAPTSIAAALALVLLGSNGKTFDEISTLLGLASGVNIQNKSQIVHEQFGRMLQNLEESSKTELYKQVNFATALFIQDSYPVRDLYKQTANSLYQSEIISLNFKQQPESAKEYINNWISGKTNGKIPNLLTESPPSATKVIIATALYFKAEWEKPFFDGVTRKRPFYPNGRSTKSDIKVEMMSNGGNFPYFKDRILNCEIMGFPYKGNQSTMYVIVPNNSSIERLKELELQLNPQELERLVDHVQYTASVILFPKMKIDTTIDLTQSLEILGVKSLFNPSEANLALLSPGLTSQVAYQMVGASEAINNAPAVPQLAAIEKPEEIFIFSRFGNPSNCTDILKANGSSSSDICQEVVNTSNRQQSVTYKRFGNKLGRKVTKRATDDSLDSIRQYLNKQTDPNRFENPGLYADQIIHKVYMDITESGTEAAAATAVSLSRDGGRITFRVDVPFFFFIRHEQTKVVLFWGSVTAPKPNFK